MMTTLIFMIEKTTKMELGQKPLEIMHKKNTAIFIDDKRQMIQKMPTSQRDQTFLNMTRDDLQLKQNLVHQFTDGKVGEQVLPKVVVVQILVNLINL